MDAAIIGSCRIGHFRIGSFNDNWEIVKQSLESLGAAEIDNLTRRKLQLDSPPDSITGWYGKSYEESDAEGIIVPKAGSSQSMVAGVYPRLDARLFSPDPWVEGDEAVDDDSNHYYEVKTVEPFKVGGGGFSHYECDLTLLRMHDLSYTDTTPTVNDARYNTKDYWDTYIDIDNLNDHPFLVCYAWPDYPLEHVFRCKNRYWDTYIDIDNLNDHPFLVCYAWPDYPLEHVFRCKNRHIIFAIDTPKSRGLPDANQKTYGYAERVGTHVCTLDTELNHLAVAELRHVIENNPEGSLRSFDVQDTEVHMFGSTRVFDTRVDMMYQRDLT